MRGFRYCCLRKPVKMRLLFRLLFLGIFLHEAAGGIHSMTYFNTGSSQVPNFPEFVGVGMVDGVQMVYYDSDTKKVEPKQEWMKKVTADDPQYLETETAASLGQQLTFKANIEILKQRFNQTGGVHIFQQMYGCEWDDETKDVKGFYQDAYDGEDFISFDLKTGTWIAAKQQAVITKNNWDNDQGRNLRYKYYYSQLCPEWVQKYVNYGSSSLMRSDVPTVSFLQKSPTSPVTCHATGFFPNRAAMHWKKDGEEIHENVDMGEILPNDDGTFQMSIDLSSVPPEDWNKYQCVFQLSGVKEDIVHTLKKELIRTNPETGVRSDGEETNNMTTTIPIIAVAIIALIIAGLGFFIYKKKNDKRPPSLASNSEIEEQLNPQPEDC